MKFKKLSVTKTAKSSNHPILRRLFANSTNRSVGFLPWANQWGDEEANAVSSQGDSNQKKEKITD